MARARPLLLSCCSLPSLTLDLRFVLKLFGHVLIAFHQQPVHHQRVEGPANRGADIQCRAERDAERRMSKQKMDKMAAARLRVCTVPCLCASAVCTDALSMATRCMAVCQLLISILFSSGGAASAASAGGMGACIAICM